MIPLALGLYSVRNELAKDLAGTLAAVRELGYVGVEFFGDFTHTAQEVATALQAAGLVCCGWHTPINALLPDRLQATVDYHKTLNNPYVVVPGFPGEYTATIADWQRTAELMNGISVQLANVDMKTGYHNHFVEFQPLEGQLPWDIFWTAADPGLIMQLDIGNALRGDANLVDILQKYPKRCTTIHIKPYSKKDGFDTMIGRDDVPWADIFQLIEAQNVTNWNIVEYESETLYTPMEGVKLAIDAMKAMGK